MKVMFIYPGQGPQFPGMLHQLPDTLLTRTLLKQACDVLEEDILALDTEDALATTRAVQLCLLVSGVVYTDFLRENDVTFDLTCGLSIGAFAAAVACGALAFEDALRLVSLRGELMQQAYPQGYGLMAIRGLFQNQVEWIVDILSLEGEIIFLANLNGEQQFVIAGTDHAMELAQQKAYELGGDGRKLNVSVPSHCSLLEGSAAILADAFNRISLKRPRCGYLSGSTARVLWKADAIADDLAWNMARQVHWNDAMVSAYQRDTRLTIELPPGAVLTGLTRSVMSTGGEALAFSQQPLETIQVLCQRYHQLR